MELHMLGRKRRLFHGNKEEPRLCTKKSLRTLLDRYESSEPLTPKTGLGCCRTSELCVNGGIKQLTDQLGVFELVWSWGDTQYSVRKVLQHLKSRQAAEDILLNDSVNKKFVEFHGDITEECGAEYKQHSWAVIEKPEEVVMYGPFYPNYNNGLHSEDIIIKQTQELLETEAVSEDWKVYVFSMNSPCLARNTDPCMLNLVQKAQEWWTVYGVKTHIGYVKCWGFKGVKETLFRDINHSQVDCIDQTEDPESNANAAEKSRDPFCENLLSAVKHLLRSESFPLMSAVQGQDWKSYFKSMHCISECKQEDEKKVLTQEVNTVIEAAQVLLSEKSGRFEEYLEKGRAFALDYTFSFSSQVSDAVQDQIRLAFQQCWKEMVQEKYVEFIRGKLTEDFNQCTVQLFIKDVVKFTKEFLQIGRIRF